MISVRGSWSLVLTMDVVVPQTRTMDDLLAVLDAVVAEDPETRGGFWRSQRHIPLPSSQLRPESYPALACGSGHAADVLAGLRIGVPGMHVNADAAAGTGERLGIGAPTDRAINTRPSILALWEAAHADLEEAGAPVTVVDFPAVTNYAGDRPGVPTIATRKWVPPEYLRVESMVLSAWGVPLYLLTGSGRGLVAGPGMAILPCH